MAVLGTMLDNLVNMEFFQLLFPFLLTLAIVYGVLYAVAKERLGKGPIGLISIVLAFFVMLYSSWNTALYLWLTNISGAFLAIACAILFLVILLGLMGIKDLTALNWKTTIIALIVIYILAVAILGATPFGLSWGSVVFSSDLWTIIFFIVVLAVVMYFLTKGDGGGGEAAAGPVKKA